MENYAGDTKIKVGTRIRVINPKKIKHFEHLVGLVGTVTHPFNFGFNKSGAIGAYLDTQDGIPPIQCNLYKGEFEIIEVK